MKNLKSWIICILALTLINACRQEAIYTEGKFNTATVIPQKLKITDVQVDDWKVGTGFKTTISKGIQVVFDLPYLNIHTVDELYKKHQVDGWIIRIIQKMENRSKILGHLYYPLQHAQRGRLGVITQQIKSGAIRIYYSAASISTRLSKLQCPALGHNKRITSVHIESERFVGKFLVSSAEDDIIGGKVERFSLRPTVFNASMSLEGRYSIEIAFFNSKSKEKKSNFLKIAGEVVVGPEESVIIKGCAGQ